MRYLTGALIAGLAWFAAGCMQFEYGVTLEDDLSGTADLNIAIDLDRVAYVSAYVQNAFAGEDGEPTEEQIEAARQEIIEEMDEDEDFSEESLRGEIGSDLPEGVELLDASVQRDGLRTAVGLRLAFDHFDQLSELRLGDEEAEDGGPPVDAEPFQDLEIVEQGDEVIIRMDPIDPTEDMEDIPWVSDEMLTKMMEGFGVTFRVTSPFDVVEHNATRRDGDTLIWEFNLATLTSGDPAGIYARLKR